MIRLRLSEKMNYYTLTTITFLVVLYYAIFIADGREEKENM